MKSVEEQPGYKNLSDLYAERTSRILAWVGAGLSTSAGVPNWSELRKRLVDGGIGKANSLRPADMPRMRNALQMAARMNDLWLSFERIGEILQTETYTRLVQRNLTVPESTPVPAIYSTLWRLHLSGVFTLNLDRLTTRAFVESRPGTLPNEFNGRDAGKSVHYLKEPKPFISNLHGRVDDSTSWILTRSEIRLLLADTGYRVLVNSAFSSFTVIFLGITADDIASGGLLGDLKAAGIQPGAHFWITDRNDAKTDQIAERFGLQVIRYSPANNHAELLEILKALGTHRSYDEPPPPVAPSISPASTELPPPEEIAALAPESIRLALNAYAAKILSQKSDDNSCLYESFLKKYALPIHTSWYVSEDAEQPFFGYRIQARVGEGAFGNVYRAESPQGEQVALKVLRQEILRKPEMLANFRRGVRSMRILSEARVAGMVPYREAYEIPASVVMDFVEGPNLEEAVNSLILEDWTSRLDVASQIVSIIRRAHMLPDRVLHRDIRPHNIMLENYYADPDALNVVLLDFDLSWHRDALDKSIHIAASSALGYLAPEQLDPTKATTRSALVDSFGIGMTIYFMVSSRHPGAGDSKSITWAQTVRDACSRLACAKWASLPNRLARLIVAATQDDQIQRPTVAEIQLELSRLTETLKSSSRIPTDLVVEEIACRAFGDGEYEWLEGLGRARRMLAKGIAIELGLEDEWMTLSVAWLASGMEDRRKLVKYLPDATQRAVSVLRSGGWVDVQHNLGPGQFRIDASADGQTLLERMDALANALGRVEREFSFS